MLLDFGFLLTFSSIWWWSSETYIGIVAEMVVENGTEELNLRHAFARAP